MSHFARLSVQSLELLHGAPSTPFGMAVNQGSPSTQGRQRKASDARVNRDKEWCQDEEMLHWLTLKLGKYNSTHVPSDFVNALKSPCEQTTLGSAMGIAHLVHYMLFIYTGDPVSYFPNTWTGPHQMLLIHCHYIAITLHTLPLLAGQNFEAKEERSLRDPLRRLFSATGL